MEPKNKTALHFGTGGIRGLVGTGEDRINVFTLGKITAAYALVLKKKYPNQKITIGLVCDTRNSSPFLMEQMGAILTQNGIFVTLSKNPLPTPLLSFWIIDKKMQGGIVITASHNPKNYNGYKLYGSDGGQIVSPLDQEIVAAAENIDEKKLSFEMEKEFLNYFSQQDEAEYLDYILSLQYKKTSKNTVIVYSALHGAGTFVVNGLFQKANYNSFFAEPSQAIPDGDFPTTENPNPEDETAWEKVLALAEEKKAAIALTNDPDADRVGLAILDMQKKWRILSGQKTAVLLTYYLLSQEKEKNNLQNAFICKSLVTTGLLSTMATSFGVECIDVLPGFKWIAQSMKKNKNRFFVLGAEESCGYLIGNKQKDKDGISAALLLAEMANFYQEQGKTLDRVLEEIQKKWGFYEEKTLSFHLDTVEKIKNSQEKIAFLRKNNTAEIASLKVISKKDYLEDPDQKADLLYWVLEEGSRIILRPSGTEPKIKLYIHVKGDSSIENQKKINQIQQFPYFQL